MKISTVYCFAEHLVHVNMLKIAIVLKFEIIAFFIAQSYLQKKFFKSKKINTIFYLHKVALYRGYSNKNAHISEIIYCSDDKFLVLLQLKVNNASLFFEVNISIISLLSRVTLVPFFSLLFGVASLKKMYGGFQAPQQQSQLDQTFHLLQNRAIAELQSELGHLKTVISEKDTQIQALEEQRNEGKFHKELTKLLEQNHELVTKLEIMESQQSDWAKQCKEQQDIIIENTRLKEIIAFQKQEQQEYMTLISRQKEQFTEELKKEMECSKKYQNLCKKKSDEYDMIVESVQEKEKMIAQLKNQDAVKDLEILQQKNKQLLNELQVITVDYQSIRDKYMHVLELFEAEKQNKEHNQSLERQQMKMQLEEVRTELNTYKLKLEDTQKQTEAVQVKYNDMEQLNLALLKGYNMEQCIRDLQTEQLKVKQLNEQTKQLTKELSVYNHHRSSSQSIPLMCICGCISKCESKVDVEPIDKSSTIASGLHIQVEQSVQQNEKLEREKLELLSTLHELRTKAANKEEYTKSNDEEEWKAKAIQLA
ncbi:LIM-type zinc finger-containing protein [Reticulomyxa filosa]|uniref:LIM-type zinc finger-containing protein n=1 Tax=Reticulomyxa filosa TaxID=46433 RepID=X6NYD4_RETFI|nr:LIM-type zinc finger-containing protein [Reticulomyxa filosa]|eukprot:ETO30986.1 LIM-type zinc finger-containing protein [Reticulomyxa filosa]